MALALQPRIPYSQPESLCRTLVYRWGGLLLGSGAARRRPARAGARRAQVDLQAGRATVEYDKARTSPVALAGVVTEGGYTAEEA